MKQIKQLVLVLASLVVGPWRGETFVFANDGPAPTVTTRSAQHWKRKTAMAIGRPDLAEAPDEDLEAAHDAHLQLINDMDDEDAPPGPAEVIDNKKLRADAAVQALANERRERAQELIAGALVSGRIKPADKAQWETDFLSDFTGTKARLANAKSAVLKVQPRTANLGQRETGADDVLAHEKGRSLKVQALVNEKMAGHSGLTYHAAFTLVQSENPALFEAMQKPGAKK